MGAENQQGVTECVGESRGCHLHLASAQGENKPPRCLKHDRPWRPEEPGSAVDHPTHYNQGKIEVVDACEDWRLSPHLFEAVTYIARAEHKGAYERDLEKAIWWLRRAIQLRRWPDLTSKQAQAREREEAAP